VDNENDRELSGATRVEASCEVPVSNLAQCVQLAYPLGSWVCLGRLLWSAVLPPSSRCKPVGTTPSPMFRAILLAEGTCAGLEVAL
jgi:hypothetical protein